MDTSNPSLGFGKDVDGGGAATMATTVANVSDLTTQLQNLGDSNGPTVIELTAASGLLTTYDFRMSTPKKFTIRAKNLTIRAQTNARIIVQNIGLILDLARADNILIQGLAFRSDGTGEADGILFDGTNSSSEVTNRIRITQCSFDGFRDIAIESRSYKSRLLATIDHCLFFDSDPGKPLEPLTADGYRPFANRGAVDITSVIDSKKNRLKGNSFVTVANNVFVDVWRRSPRVAFPGNFGHIYNNLLYRWGFGNTENKKSNGTDTWNGMSVGNEAVALIQANRFIPWNLKLAETIQIDLGTTVDIGFPALDLFKPDRTNRFDSPDGTENPAGGPPRPKKGFPDIDVNSIYNRAGLARSQPDVTAKDQVNWLALAKAAGSSVDKADDPEDPRKDLLLLL
ncbi:MAG: Pectate lyase [Acidobacteriota bacterium]|jgi:pectate lyase|nr:Pectate lyase [Acidobacteriota bacterium]